MGNRRHGTWAQVHESIHDHAKTIALGSALQSIGVPEAWATDVAVAQVHRIACWAARDGNTGVVGHLTDTRFAQIVRWPKARHAALRKAWRDSGFLDNPGTPNERIHDFEEYFSHLLRKRSRDELEAAEPAPDRQQKGADPAPEWRREGADPAPEGRPPGAPHAGARDRAGARAFRKPKTESRNGISPPRRGGAAEGAPSEPGRDGAADSAVPGPQTNGDAPEPAPATPRTRRASEGPKAPTVELLTVWKEAAAAAGYPAVPVNGQHAKTLADVWRAAGQDTAAVVRAVAAFFADRDPFTLRQAHGIGEFARTSARWLAEAAGTAPSATNTPPRVSRLRANAAAALLAVAANDQGSGLLPGATP